MGFVEIGGSRQRHIGASGLPHYNWENVEAHFLPGDSGSQPASRFISRWVEPETDFFFMRHSDTLQMPALKSQAVIAVGGSGWLNKQEGRTYLSV